MKRTPLKRTPFNVSTSAMNFRSYGRPLRKVSPKKRKSIIDQVAEQHEMREAFYKFWNSRVHRCESCGDYLGEELRSYHVDHLLDKAKYPELKLEPLNFFLVCLECHASKTNGSPKPLHKIAIKNAKKMFLNEL